MHLRRIRLPSVNMERWLRHRTGACCKRVGFRRCVRRYDDGCAVEHGALICGLEWTIRSRIRDFGLFIAVEVVSISRSQPPRNLARLLCCAPRDRKLSALVGAPIKVGPGVVANGNGDWPCKW